MNTKKLTILFIHRGFVARADFAGARPEPSRLVRTERPDVDAIGDLVVAASRAGPSLRGRRVLLLLDDVVVLTAELEPSVIRGVDDAALGEALGYEAQAISGLASMESATAWARAGGPGRSYLVAQMPAYELALARDAVARLGGRLLGVCHPAGLPIPLAAESKGGAPFLRTETWGGLRAEIERDDAGQLAIRFERGRAPRRDEGGATPTERLRVSGGVVTDGADESLFRLTDEATLSLFLSRWRMFVSGDHSRLPILAPAAKPLSMGVRWGVAAGIAASVAAFGCFDYRRLAEARDGAVVRLEAARAPVDRYEVLRRRANKLDREIKALDVAPAASRTEGPVFRAELPDRLLEVPARQCPEGLVVSSVDLGWKRSVVSGFATDARGIDALLIEVTRVLDGTGYVIGSVEKSRHDGGWFAFEFVLAPGRESKRTQTRVTP